ncbi:hypothetical protein [Tenacibaculum haliotis]|uniref:hypothetical protein n=1 Tax=Tenacibaculum haliotis TaxID=1888914 RepID=UPI0021AE8707|nr:hypothetical protein [Tenacibaculum haliotis]MCT4700213.1 hypothetical protein [Tenacibaculum haliotis]
MKKLACIALFSFAMLANATEGNEVETNNSKEVKIEKSVSKKVENTSTTEEEDLSQGFGSQANGWYAKYRNDGYSHREARPLRRVWVRKCRGNGPGGMWHIF